MYEKLDKLREEVRRCERRAAEAQNRLKAAQEKLKEGEASQILSDVGAMKLSPEDLAKVLSLVKSGALQNAENDLKEEKEERFAISETTEDSKYFDTEDEKEEIVDEAY